MWLAGVILAAGGSASIAQAGSASALAVEDFFRDARIRQVQLSPQGQRVALTMTSAQGRTGLFTVELDRPDKPVLVARFADADIGDVSWVSESRLVFDLTDLRSTQGDRRFSPGLFSVAPDGSQLRTLVKPSFQGVTDSSGPQREPLPFNHDLLEVLDDGRHVIVGRLESDGHRGWRAVVPLRLDVESGRATSLAEGAPADVRSWLFDASGRPRVAVTSSQGRRTVWWLPPEATEWQKIQDGQELEQSWSPLFLDQAGRLYVSAPWRGHAVLKRFDFDRRAPQPEPLISTPGFDFGGRLITERASGRLLGARVLTDAQTTVWFDEGMRRLQAMVDERLPGRVNQLDCRRCGRDDAVLLVRSWSDRDPGRWFAVDVARKRWVPIGATHPQIDPRSMATVDFHRIQARDGRDLPVWVTTPAGTAPGQRRPVVVMVHGGPFVRGGYWAWNPMNQFLASRGYLVVEPEFRGSTGYGAAHYRAGWKQWGRGMQDDVTDALQWAVSKGWADPRRACIAGASYGGYSALMGLVREPGLYRCAVAWVAVTDPLLLFDWRWDSDLGDDWREHGLPRVLGDKERDAQALREVSPLHQAARIREPVLLAFGTDDRRVPLVHGTRMRDALRAAGQEPVWITYPGEGHGWRTFENRVDFARRVEDFLGQHLR
jgi:dipeptidyl aminopeptidase/acylaminoacyl peptidase